jgi:hypothetical protein
LFVVSYLRPKDSKIIKDGLVSDLSVMAVLLVGPVFFLQLVSGLLFLMNKVEALTRGKRKDYYLGSSTSGLAVGLRLGSATWSDTVVFCFDVSVEGWVTQVGLSAATCVVPVCGITANSSFLLAGSVPTLACTA